MMGIKTTKENHLLRISLANELMKTSGISKIKPRVRHLINVKEPHFLHFEA